MKGLAALAIVGSAYSGYASAKAKNDALKFQARQAQQQAALAAKNASYARIRADKAREIGKYQEGVHRIQVGRLKGTQRANYAASGVLVDRDTPQAVVEETAAMGEVDALMLRHNAELQAWGYEVQAENAMAQSEAALQQAQMYRSSQSNPWIAAGLSGLSSAASIFGPGGIK